MFNKELYLLSVDRTTGRHAGVVGKHSGPWLWACGIPPCW
jgi:hypothetical protein